MRMRTKQIADRNKRANNLKIIKKVAMRMRTKLRRPATV